MEKMAAATEIATEIQPESCATEDESLAPLKSRFFSHLCHEIRTPLGAIVGLSNILKSPQCTEQRQNECIAMLQDSANMLMQLVNNVLDLSKIHAGAMQIERIPFSLEEIAVKAMHIISGQAEEKKLGVLMQIGELPAQLIGDPLRLQQVLLNLLNNAVKFTHVGYIGLEIKADQTATGHYQVQITISDTGIGISPERQKTIFDDYEQAGASVCRHYGGTGLGLAICKRLVILMGGVIAVESILGAGSRFTVVLPLAASAG